MWSRQQWVSDSESQRCGYMGWGTKHARKLRHVIHDKGRISETDKQDLTKLPSKEHLRWQQTRKLLAYRESTRTILIITCPYSKCNPLYKVRKAKRKQTACWLDWKKNTIKENNGDKVEWTENRPHRTRQTAPPTRESMLVRERMNAFMAMLRWSSR